MSVINIKRILFLSIKSVWSRYKFNKPISSSVINTLYYSIQQTLKTSKKSLVKKM